MTAADPLAAICGYLSQQPDVTAIVGGNIFRPELPPPDDVNMPFGAVVVRPAGGYQMFGGSTLRLGDPRVDVLCYGSTRQEADQLGREVTIALKNLRRQSQEGCLLHWARISAGPIPLVDPDTTWPLSFVSAQVMHAEQALT